MAIAQQVIWLNEEYDKIQAAFQQKQVKKLLLVCGKSIETLGVYSYLQKIHSEGSCTLTRFSDFTPNPQYASVVKGVESYKEHKCEGILAIGGGSAMDVAKCIRAFVTMNLAEHFLSQEIVENRIPLFVMPTTAGTGSEATRFAVIYDNGVKQSVSHKSCIPDVVFLQETVLNHLPLYQKQVTLLDALCQGIESYWSVRATDESKEYAKEAISLLTKYAEAYLSGDNYVNRFIMQGAYLAGKAIDLSQTTAAHAMSYKLTSMYGIAHGQAVAMCLPHIWKYMLEHGDDSLIEVFHEIAKAMNQDSIVNGIAYMEELVDKMNFTKVEVKENDFEELVASVNVERLQNHPVVLEKDVLEYIYKRALK